MGFVFAFCMFVCFFSIPKPATLSRFIYLFTNSVFYCCNHYVEGFFFICSCFPVHFSSPAFFSENTQIWEIEHRFLPLAQLLAGTSQRPVGREGIVTVVLVVHWKTFLSPTWSSRAIVEVWGKKKVEHTAGFLVYSPYRVARGKNEDLLYFGYSSGISFCPVLSMGHYIHLWQKAFNKRILL